MAPKINRKNLKDVHVREGETVYLDAKVEGEPTPVTEWKLRGRTITSFGDIVIVHAPNITKLHFDDTKRSHTGVYTVIASNQWGEDTVEIKVVVICM